MLAFLLSASKKVLNIFHVIQLAGQSQDDIVTLFFVQT